MTDLLRRAWDALDTFKQAYPENWNQEDEQVLEDLMRADLKLSGVKLKWVGLNPKDVPEIYADDIAFLNGAKWAEAKLKELNT